MQEIFGNIPFLLQASGILLAILSFTGASKRIEIELSKLRNRIRTYTPVLRNGLSDFLATPTNIRRYWRSAIWTTGILLTGLAVMMQFEAEPKAKFDAIYELLLPWSLWKAGMTAALILPVLYMIWAIFGFISGVAVYILLTTIWAIFWALSRPPSGIMGSIGLAIALSGPTIRMIAG